MAEDLHQSSRESERHVSRDDEDQNPDDDFQFNPQDKSQRGNIRQTLRAAGRHRKAIFIGSGLAVGAVSTLVVVFLMLIPLKIEHIVTNIQSRFFASSESALDKEGESLLSNYIKRSVLPALTKCRGTTLDKNCNPNFGTVDNPIDALYKGWSQARLENKLAENYGIEFRAVKSGLVTRYYMKAPGIKNPNGDDITAFAAPGDDKDLFQEVSKGATRQYVKDSFGKITNPKAVWYRYKVGRLFEEKYGINRCNYNCDNRDALRDFPKEKANAAMIMITQKVIVPRTETWGIVMECLLRPDCHAESTQPTTPQDGSTGELAGAPENTDTDTAIRTTLADLAKSYGISDHAIIQKMIDDYKGVSEKGYQKYFLEKALQKIGLGELSGGVADKATVVTWVNEAAKDIGSLENSGPNIKKLQYVTNSTADAKLFMVLRTEADEIHTGKGLDAAEVGSFVKALGPSSSTSSTGAEIVGGTASAEETPLYNAVINGRATSATKDFKCSNRKAPSGLLCAEEKLGGGNAVANDITGTLKTPPLSYITYIANAWNKVFGGIFNFVGNIFGSIIGNIPGVSDATSFVTKAAEPFFKFLTDKLIPNPFGVPMSGGRTGNLAILGGMVAGDAAAHTTLGAPAVRPEAAAQVAIDQENSDLKEFSHRPLFARLFSTDTQYSLISRVAMDIPLGFQSAPGNTVATLLSAPFAAITHSFGSILSPKAVAGSDPVAALARVYKEAGETPYAYTGDVSYLKPYWQQHCSDNAAQAYQSDADYQKNNWNQDAANHPDPVNGMPTNSTANPCLLIKSYVCAGGVTSDTSLCTSDDMADAGSSTSTSGNSDTGLVWPFASKDTSQYNRVDQGWDIQDRPGAPIYAIAPGTLHIFKTDPGGFGNDYPTEELDSSIGGPTNWVYYGHVHIIPSLNGKHVTAGQLIAYANRSNPENGSAAPTGWLEIGFAQPNTDAPVDKGGETAATAAGQKMKDILINAQPASGGGP